MSEKQLPIGLRFSLLHRASRKKMDEMLSEKELTGVQFGVLNALLHLEQVRTGEISQRDLEQISHVTHPTMTEILKRLEKKEFIRCETSNRDRRFKSISSTEKALRLQDDAARVDEETSQWLCRGLEQGQIDALLTITDRMLENIWADCPKGCEKTL